MSLFADVFLIIYLIIPWIDCPSQAWTGRSVLANRKPGNFPDLVIAWLALVNPSIKNKSALKNKVKIKCHLIKILRLNISLIFILLRKKLQFHLWAVAAMVSSQTSSYMSAAFGWGPSTPWVSRPLATFLRRALCLSTISCFSA